MRPALDDLTRLVDRPVLVRTVSCPRKQPLEGSIFSVSERALELLRAPPFLETIALEEIVAVTLDARAGHPFQDPPPSEDYPRAKRALLLAEQAQLLFPSEEPSRKLARSARELLRRVRRAFPLHEKTERMLERAHFLATGRWDYERRSASSGEVKNHNYRRAKDAVIELGRAREEGLPESEVAAILATIARHAGRALAVFPRHDELREWLARAESSRRELSPKTRESSRLERPFVAGRDD